MGVYSRIPASRPILYIRRLASLGETAQQEAILKDMDRVFINSGATKRARRKLRDARQGTRPVFEHSFYYLNIVLKTAELTSDSLSIHLCQGCSSSSMHIDEKIFRRKLDDPCPCNTYLFNWPFYFILSPPLSFVCVTTPTSLAHSTLCQTI